MTVPEGQAGAGVGQDEDIDNSAERYWQLWRHWFGGGQPSSTPNTPTSLAWTTAIDILHLDGDRTKPSNVDVLKWATEAYESSAGSEQQEDLIDSAWSTSPYTVMVAPRGTKNPDMNVIKPDEMSNKNDFFHTFWGAESGSLNNLTYQNGSINSERNVENYSKGNAAKNYDTIRSGEHDNCSTVTGITSSTKFMGMRSDDTNSNVTKTKGFYNLESKASSPSHEVSDFQDVGNITGDIVASESETASDDAETNSYEKKNEGAETSSISPIPLTDTPFNSVADRPVTNNTLGLSNDNEFSTVGTEFTDYMNASHFKNIPDESSKYDKVLLSNIRRNYTTLDDGISNILADSTNENGLNSARHLSAGTSNSSFTDRIVIDVGVESNTVDKILFANSTQYRLWHFIREVFKALEEHTLELIHKISRPIQKLGHGLVSNMAPLMSYNTLSQKSQVTLLSNGSMLNSARDKSSTTGTSFPDGIALLGENELSTDDFSGQTLGNMSSDVTIQTTNNELPTHHPEPVPNLVSWYPKSWRSKRQISLTAPERIRSTKPSEINVDSGPTTKIKALSKNARCRTSKNCAWNYENALDYPEYFNTKVQTTTSQGISLSPSKLWLEIKSWTASKTKLLNVSYITALLHNQNNEDKGTVDDKYVTYDEDEAEIVEAINNNNQVAKDYTGDTTEINYYDNRLRDGLDSGLEDYYTDDEIYGETEVRNKTVNGHENVVALR